MLSLQIANKKLEYSLTIADDVPDRLSAIQNRLRQILLNLLGNAIKIHGSRAGFLFRSVRRSASRLRRRDAVICRCAIRAWEFRRTSRA